MPLKLEYPDKYRLWADLVRGNTDRLFVGDDGRYEPGSRVAIEVHIATFKLPLVVKGTVVGRRAGSRRFRAGTYVHIAESDLDTCRRLLDLQRPPDLYGRVRSAERVPFDVSVRFHAPDVPEGGHTRNLSEKGLFLSTTARLAAGELVSFELHLADGPLALKGEVVWASESRKLAGLAFVDVDAEAAARLRLAVEAARERAASGESGAPTVLVADDDPMIVQLISTVLTQHNYEVVQARDGQETLDLVRALRPRLVVIDILMPRVDGTDVCKMMRADVEMQDIPVIFVSALEPDTLHDVADEAGATDYLCKPLQLTELLDMVGEYLKT